MSNPFETDNTPERMELVGTVEDALRAELNRQQANLMGLDCNAMARAAVDTIMMMIFRDIAAISANIQSGAEHIQKAQETTEAGIQHDGQH